MCGKECKQKDKGYHHCPKCGEIMCMDCHLNIDYKTDERRAVLKERVKDLVSVANAPLHWALDDSEEWISIAQLRQKETFSREEDVTFVKIKDQFGRGSSQNAVWAFDDSRNHINGKKMDIRQGDIGGTEETGSSSSTAVVPVGGAASATVDKEEWYYWNHNRRRTEWITVEREFRAEWDVDEDENWTSTQWH